MIVAHDDAPDVVAVVPTLGGAVPRLRACIESVLRSETDLRLAVVIVWNDPRRPVPDLGAVTVLEPGLNLGFPGGLNHGRAAVEASYVWIVQDDVVVEPFCLARLLGRLRADDVTGVVSPVVVDERGLVPAGTRGGVIGEDGRMAHHVPRTDTLPRDVDDAVDWVSSSGSLVRASAWDAVGGFDPAFFPLLWSDVDFCWRLRSAGYSSVIEGSARIQHEGHASTPTFLGHFLYVVHGDRFARRAFGDDPEPGVDPTVSSELLATVARAASLGYVDLAGHAAALNRQRGAERDEALEQLGVRERQLADLGAELERLRAVEARHEQELRERAAGTAALRAEIAAGVAERSALRAQIGADADDAAVRAAGLAAATAELAALRGTWSWRLTAPLRALRGLRLRSWSPRH